MERSIDIYTARLSDSNVGKSTPHSVNDSPVIPLQCVSEDSGEHLLILTDAKTKANIATELRDSIETLCSGPSYPRFLAKLWPVFKRILQGEPVFMASSPDHVSFKKPCNSLIILTML
jgi:transformation/transcription domain-associated protein